MALLQPAPEVYDLFDDILLLCEGEHLFRRDNPLLESVAITTWQIAQDVCRMACVLGSGCTQHHR